MRLSLGPRKVFIFDSGLGFMSVTKIKAISVHFGFKVRLEAGVRARVRLG